MDKVEKFKELLEFLLEEYSTYFETDGIYSSIDILEKVETKKEELIKMYSELEENKEKPVIRCKEYKVKPSYDWVWEDKIIDYRIHFIVNKKEHELRSYNVEEKDGMLITDDFIFIKEALNVGK